MWCEDPGYPAARNAIAHCGGRPVSVPVDQSGIVVARGRAAAPDARAAYVTPSHQFPLGMQMSMPRRLELLDWAKGANAFIVEDDYDSEFRYDGAPLLSLAGIDHLRRVIYMGTFAKTLFPGLRIGYCALPEALIAPVTKARAAIDRFPSTLMEGAIADMLNSGAFSANVRKVRGIYREARDVLARTLSEASEGQLHVPVPSQGLHLVARFGAAVRCRSRGTRQGAAPASMAGCWQTPVSAFGRWPAMCSDLPATRSTNWSTQRTSWRRPRWRRCGSADACRLRA